MRYRLLIAVSVLVAIAIASMYTVTAEAQYVKNGLVAHWTFDEAGIDGETLIDLTGDFNGTINGKPEVVEGKIGEAMEFNVKNGQGDFVDLGVDINSKLLGDFTIEGWFMFAELKPAGLHELMCSREGAWAASKGLSYHYCNNYNNEGLNMYFRLHHAGGPCAGGKQGFEPETEKWCHLVGTYDGKSIVYYSDGESIGNAACATGIEESATSLKIAHSQLFGAQWDFVGSVDEVRIYDRALSGDEVKKNFASTGVAVEYSAKKLSLTWGQMKVSR